MANQPAFKAGQQDARNNVPPRTQFANKFERDDYNAGHASGKK